MPNIRRNLHFKLDTSCRDSEGLRRCLASGERFVSASAKSSSRATAATLRRFSKTLDTRATCARCSRKNQSGVVPSRCSRFFVTTERSLILIRILFRPRTDFVHFTLRHEPPCFFLVALLLNRVLFILLGVCRRLSASWHFDRFSSTRNVAVG